jgi:hypothetical protein
MTPEWAKTIMIIIRRDNENGRRKEATTTITCAGALSRKGSLEVESFLKVALFKKVSRVRPTTKYGSTRMCPSIVIRSR